MRRKNLPSVAEVRAALAYDKAAGVLTWKQDRGGVKAGSRAGSIAPKGYVQIGFAGTQFGAHVLAFVIVRGRWPKPKAHIDHEDGDGMNNIWRNLRESTPSQNGRNRPKGANANNKSTGVRGVYRKGKGQFSAFLHLHVGTFKTIVAASRAIERVRALHHGAFANTGAHRHGR